MIANNTLLSDWKHKITVWRKQCYVLGVIFGVALWACLAVGWPIMLGVYWWLNR